LLDHNPPLSYPDRILEIQGISDASEHKVKANTFAMAQQLTTMVMNLAGVNAVNGIALEEGRDPQALLALAGLSMGAPAQSGPTTSGTSNGSQPRLTEGSQTNPPPHALADAGGGIGA